MELRVEQWCQSPTGTNWIHWATDTYTHAPAHVDLSRRFEPIPVYKRAA